MRIGFDVRPLLHEETGVGVNLRNLLLSLARIDRTSEYFLFSSSLKARLPRSKIPLFERLKFSDFRFPVKAVNFFWYEWGWPPLDLLIRAKLDLTHSVTPLVLPTKGRKIITVHDLFFWDFPEEANPEARKYFKRLIGRSLETADGIIAVSRATKKDLLEKFAIPEDKIRLIYHGVDALYLQSPHPDELALVAEKYSLPSAFILSVGTLERRKNFLALVDAMKIVRSRFENVPLVIAGPQSQDAEPLRERIAKEDLGSRVKILGFVAGPELRALYRLASAFVFPSLCEGFGNPLLEAMASGLPVAASGVSSLPEIGGEAAVYFDPKSPEDMADKIMKLLQDTGLRQELVAKGKKRVREFDWERTAFQTIDFYRAVLGR